MVAQTLNVDELSLLYDQIKASDFDSALSLLLSSVDKSKHEFIINEISLRYTAWTGLIDTSVITSAVVIETGLGSTIEVLSNILDKVYAIYTDKVSMEISRSRIANDNVEYVPVENIKNLSLESKSTILVAYNDIDNRNIESLFFSLLEKHNPEKYVYLTNIRNPVLNKVRLLRKCSPELFFLQGQTRDIFKLTSKIMKRRQIGNIKYMLYYLNYYLQNRPVFVTDINIRQSLYSVIIEELIGTSDFCIMDFIFIKPNGIIALIEKGSELEVVRITSDNLGITRLKNNNSFLKFVYDSGFCISPVCKSEKSIGSYFCSEESYIEGKNVTSGQLKSTAFRKRFYDYSYDILIGFQVKSKKDCVISESLYIDLVDTPVTTAMNKLPDKYNNIFLNIKAFLYSSFIGSRCSLVLNHGDYSADNLLVHKGVVSGLIDWEYAYHNGLPLIDLIFLISHIHKKITGSGIVTAMDEVILDGNIDQFESDLLLKYCHYFNINKDKLLAYGIMCIMTFIAFRLDMNSDINRGVIFDKMFSGILIKINTIIENENI